MVALNFNVFVLRSLSLWVKSPHCSTCLFLCFERRRKSERRGRHIERSPTLLSSPNSLLRASRRPYFHHQPHPTHRKHTKKKKIAHLHQSNVIQQTAIDTNKGRRVNGKKKANKRQRGKTSIASCNGRCRFSCHLCKDAASPQPLLFFFFCFCCCYCLGRHTHKHSCVLCFFVSPTPPA
jgi:hypothetical protein